MLSNIITDLVIVLIFAIAGFIGVKVGFFSILAKPVKYVGSIIITLTCAGPVGRHIVAPMIRNPVSNKIAEFLSEKCADITAENALDELPTLIKFAASLGGVDLQALVSAEGLQSVVDVVIANVMDPVINIVAIVIGGIVLYIIAKVLLSLGLWLLNSVLDSGAIGVVNKTLGCVFVLVITFIAVWAIIGCSDLIINLPAVQNTKWGAEFTGGAIYRMFKNLSIVDLLLSF